LSATTSDRQTPADLLRWLSEIALPSFARLAVSDGAEGYTEFLSPDRTVSVRPDKSTLSTARLIYCFSHAAVLDPAGPGLAAAGHGLDFLRRRLANPAGGFYRSVGANGQPLDGYNDLGDLAFVLFACGWYHRASGDASVLSLAERTMDFLDSRMAAPNGGFHDDDKGSPTRRQNPHMHLLEACHVLAEQSGETAVKPGRWLNRAHALVALLKDHFTNPETGALYEQFDADWHPLPDAPLEPGSHFEWVWALARHRQLTGDDSVQPLADRLYRFALTHGLDHDPAKPCLAFDAIDGSGRPLATTKLLWPQTEAIKAFAVRAARDPDASRRLSALLDLLFRLYIDKKSGLFHNQLERDGTPRAVAMPLRVLYHLELALVEAAAWDPPAACRQSLAKAVAVAQTVAHHIRQRMDQKEKVPHELRKG
jgi:mannose/cellobiose epimerase-like protein (N-acyl-D-glucosamine 2-epimerase family)